MNLGWIALILSLFDDRKNPWPFWKRLRDGFKSREELTKEFKIKWNMVDQYDPPKF